MRNRKLLLSIAWLGFAPAVFAEETLTVYSSRAEHLIKPVFDLYTKETGVKIEYLTDKEAPLIRRIKSEGRRTPADVLITVDAGNLWFASETDIFEPIKSKVLNKNVPEHLRSPNGEWYGLSVRARTVVYSTNRVKEKDLSTYENLAEKDWKGRLCLRTSNSVYNQSLVSMLIAQHGTEQAEAIVAGWVNNLAVPVFPNDTNLLKAIVAGTCDVGIVNTYYFGRLQQQDPKIPVAIFWPNQKSTGAHINVSGGGVVKYSKKKKLAQEFLEWVSSMKAQKIFADVNYEYAVTKAVEASDLVKAWGDFQPSTLNVSKLGENQPEAIKLMDRVKYR